MGKREELYKQLGVVSGRSDEDFWKGLTIDSFLGFGYEPTAAEVMALVPTAAGLGGGTRGPAAVADYVRTVQADKERQANDPLQKFIDEQKVKAEGFSKEAQDVYGQLKQIVSSAPKLFGSLTEDQINQYLAPLQQATAESSARLEGAYNRRGLVGSNIEAGALATNERQFRENALATGLQVGLNQQTLQQQMYQNYLNQVLGLYGQSTGFVGQGAGQISAQNLNQGQFLAGLPLLERGVAAQERAQAEAAAKAKGTNWGSIGTLAGMVGGAALAPFTGGLSLPVAIGLGGSIGGAVGGIAGGNSTLASGSASQIPWWMMLNQRQTQPYTSGTSSTALTPSASSYGFVPGGVYNA